MDKKQLQGLFWLNFGLLQSKNISDFEKKQSFLFQLTNKSIQINAQC